MNRDNVISGLVCLTLAIYVFWLSGSVPATTSTDVLGGRWLPRMLSILMALFSMALVVTGWLGVQVKGAQGARQAAKPSTPESVAPNAQDEMSQKEREETESRHGGINFTMVGTALLMGLYVWILPTFGFFASSLLLFGALIYLLGQRKPTKVILGAIATTGMMYVLFGLIFKVRLPVGSLFP